MRLREALVGATRGVEIRAQPGVTERAVQPETTLSGGHREHVPTRRERVDHLGHAVEQRELVIRRQIVMAVTLDHARIRSLVQIGHRVPKRIAQAEPDHIARALLGNLGQAEVAGRGLHRTHDRPRGVHQRAVPVEDDQIEMLSHVFSPRRRAGR